MIFSLVAMIGLEKCCITSACLQWLCHSGERTVARGPLVLIYAPNVHFDCVLEPPNNTQNLFFNRGNRKKCIFPQILFWF